MDNIPAVFEPFMKDAPCTRCKGQGFRVYDHRPGEKSPCSWCKETGTFPGVDLDKIRELISTSRGTKGTRRLRAAWPSKLNPWRSTDVTVRRAYYVWRQARFDGGADVTLPMTAGFVTEGDPHTKLLDAMAAIVARQTFGTARAGAHRWGRAFGFIKQDEAGLPSSAYEGGEAVSSGIKPEFEYLELK